MPLLAGIADIREAAPSSGPPAIFSAAMMILPPEPEG